MERCKNMMFFSIVLLTSTAMYAMDESSHAGALTDFSDMPALEDPKFALNEDLLGIQSEEGIAARTQQLQDLAFAPLDPVETAALTAAARRRTGALAIGGIAGIATLAQRFDPAAIVKTVTSGATRGGTKVAYPITKGVLDTCEQLAGPIAGLGVILYFYYEIKEKGQLELQMKKIAREKHADHEQITTLEKLHKHEKQAFHSHLVQEHNETRAWHAKIKGIVETNSKNSNTCKNCATMRGSLAELGTAMATRVQSLKQLHDDAGPILKESDTAPAKNAILNFFNKLVGHKQ